MEKRKNYRGKSWTVVVGVGCVRSTTYSRTTRFSLPPADWFLFPDQLALIVGVQQPPHNWQVPAALMNGRQETT